MLFGHVWRFPNSPKEANEPNSYIVGQRVFVKPSQNTRCDVSWPVGIVTENGSDCHVEVDGVKRHIADVRAVNVKDEDVGLNNCDSDVEVELDAVPICDGNSDDRVDNVVVNSQSVRRRRPPAYLDDYVQ